MIRCLFTGILRIDILLKLNTDNQIRIRISSFFMKYYEVGGNNWHTIIPKPQFIDFKMSRNEL